MKSSAASHPFVRDAGKLLIVKPTEIPLVSRKQRGPENLLAALEILEDLGIEFSDELKRSFLKKAWDCKNDMLAFWVWLRLYIRIPAKMGAEVVRRALRCKDTKARELIKELRIRIPDLDIPALFLKQASPGTIRKALDIMEDLGIDISHELKQGFVQKALGCRDVIEALGIIKRLQVPIPGKIGEEVVRKASRSRNIKAQELIKELRIKIPNERKGNFTGKQPKHRRSQAGALCQ
jgi:hypothetical protein